MSNDHQKRELSLLPYTYLYMQDVAKGTIRVCCGPLSINQTAQEQPVVYEHKKGFRPVASLAEAVRPFAVAVEGSYLQLLNPSSHGNVLGGSHPDEGTISGSTPLLSVGRRVNIPGPAHFPLWPGQVANAIRGHRLNSNQYLRARVYDADAANRNWDQAVTDMLGDAEKGDAEKGDPAKSDSTKTGAKTAFVKPNTLVNGQILIIRGTEVAFYMPPTGITVESYLDERGEKRYVRDALTLERMEYTILLSENGTKQYERGPKVVFPQPDQTFLTKKDEKGNPTSKFPAIELNEIQGIHIKVTAPYEENGVKYTEGQEIFLTGKTSPIYYPREEHAVIRYDGRSKTFATSVPKGTGRYVLDRNDGTITKIEGPKMLLPDPIHQVIVRRALTDFQCKMWYPGNVEVLEVNRLLREIAERSPTTRAGAVSEGDAMRADTNRYRKGGNDRGNLESTRGSLGGQVMYAATSAAMDSSRVSGDQDIAGDEIARGSTYTQPRTIMLDTKYQGVPVIEVWTGHAVMVIDADNKRRVVIGPNRLLLGYDETLEVLSLSTGKPKTTDRLYQTPYLQVEGNRVSDIIEVETRDHVKVRLKYNLLINFEGDSARWFNESNYVKMTTDHVRSHLKGAVRSISIEEFYVNSTQMIRDLLLGKKADGQPRAGMKFEVNNSRIADVEVLDVEIVDSRVRDQLAQAQFDTVQQSLQLEKMARDFEMTRRREEIMVQSEQVKAQGRAKRDEIAREDNARAVETTLLKLIGDLKVSSEEAKAQELHDQAEAVENRNRLAREKETQDQRLFLLSQEQELEHKRMHAEAESVHRRMSALSGPIADALVALGNQDVLVKMANAWSMQEMLGGKSVVDAFIKAVEGTPLKSALEKVLSKGSHGSANGNGATRSLLSDQS